MCVSTYVRTRWFKSQGHGCENSATFSMNRLRPGTLPCDKEIQAFVVELQFGDFATMSISNVPPAIRGVVLRTFYISRELEALDAGFIRHAMMLPDAWNDGVPLHAHEVTAFISAHGLSPATIRKLRLPPESLTGLMV